MMDLEYAKNLLEIIKTGDVVLVKNKVAGVEVYTVATIIPLRDGSTDIYPVAVLCGQELFKIMTPPNPADKIIIEKEDNGKT